MLCLNAPRKPMARLHVLVSLILVLVCTFLAFMPLTKIVVSDETKTSIENLFTYIESQSSGESAEERDELAVVDEPLAGAWKEADAGDCGFPTAGCCCEFVGHCCKFS